MKIDKKTRRTPPCKGCKCRHPGCHDKCKLYLSWKSELEKMNEEIRKYKQMNDVFSKIT